MHLFWESDIEECVRAEVHCDMVECKDKKMESALFVDGGCHTQSIRWLKFCFLFLSFSLSLSLFLVSLSFPPIHPSHPRHPRHPYPHSLTSRHPLLSPQLITDHLGQATVTSKEPIIYPQHIHIPSSPTYVSTCMLGFLIHVIPQ